MEKLYRYHNGLVSQLDVEEMKAFGFEIGDMNERLHEGYSIQELFDYCMEVTMPLKGEVKLLTTADVKIEDLRKTLKWLEKNHPDNKEE